ncbi:uncharacterized protein EAE97_004936 [Botrytis byssoidea]|uniref:Uncharacterized protein n=1 Tax=Botrytis byssoidea TaxID=139641 RepID=A0A9P5IU38_9HELO|nr:uncharacterized protein EAE97_004936 [Botrytis byssoidea]KAF7945898.1 hypothetical protein EAE97_004936 [Botrytis byssoidea]
MVLLSKFMTWLLVASTAISTQAGNDKCSTDQDLSSYDLVELQALRSEWTTGVDIAFKEHGWEHLPNRLKNWILEHPWQTAFHIVNGVVLFTPAGATSFASFLQSKIGLVAAKSWFALFQSAPMGGWGSPIVNTATQFGALANSFVAAAWEWSHGNSTA